MLFNLDPVELPSIDGFRISDLLKWLREAGFGAYIPVEKVHVHHYARAFLGNVRSF